jgi:hypothetical protein
MTHTAEPMTLAQVSQSLRNRAKTIRESEDYVEGISDRMADWFDVRADAIKAELAKQRDAEPVAYGHWAEGLPEGTRLMKYDGVPCVMDTPSEFYNVPLYLHPQQHNAVEAMAEDISIVAKAIADVIGHGMREKCEDMARAAIAAVASRDSVFLVEVARIADDYVPTNEKDCALALGEMREALKCAIDAVNHQQCNAVEVTDKDARMLYSIAAYMAKNESPKCADDLIYLASRIEKSLSAVASRDREDAERYRWLRGHSIFCNDSMHEIWFDKSNDRGDVEGFDAAIDAARRENKS